MKFSILLTISLAFVAVSHAADDTLRCYFCYGDDCKNLTEEHLKKCGDEVVTTPKPTSSPDPTASTESSVPTESTESTVSTASTESPEPTESTASSSSGPTESTESTVSTASTESPEPTESTASSSGPTESTESTVSTGSTEPPVPTESTASPGPTESTESTVSTASTEPPVPTESTASPGPTESTESTVSTASTEPPVPTESTASPAPTESTASPNINTHTDNMILPSGGPSIKTLNSLKSSGAGVLIRNYRSISRTGRADGDTYACYRVNVKDGDDVKPKHGCVLVPAAKSACEVVHEENNLEPTGDSQCSACLNDGCNRNGSAGLQIQSLLTMISMLLVVKMFI